MFWNRAGKDYKTYSIVDLGQVLHHLMLLTGIIIISFNVLIKTTFILFPSKIYNLTTTQVNVFIEIIADNNSVLYQLQFTYALREITFNHQTL